MFDFDQRSSDSPLVEGIWRTRSGRAGEFTSVAASRLEIVVTRQYGRTTLTVRGPETIAKPAAIPADAEIFGILFKLGAYLPRLPTGDLVDRPIDLPSASSDSFWLHSSAWQFPDFDNTDAFVDRLVGANELSHEPIVDAALRDELHGLSLRSVQRRFLRATGLTQGAVGQIERAQRAKALLERGVSILDTVEQAGYADQSHLTRALKRLIGRTPAQLLRAAPAG